MDRFAARIRLRLAALLPAAVVLAALTGCQPSAPQAKDWSEHTYGLPFVVGYEPGMQAARKNGKPALLFVTTTWCTWCKKLAADNFNHPDIRPLLDEYQLVLVDGDMEQAAARSLGADGFPHIVLQSALGETRAVGRGYQSPQQFREFLESGQAAASQS